MKWEIKSKNNELKVVIHSLEHNDEWMKERYVTANIESPAPVDFEIGDWLTYRGERFEINYDPGKIKSAPRYAKGDAFKYNNVKFNSLADELTRCDFLDLVLEDNKLHFTGLPKFTFYGGVRDLANRIQANLNKTYGKGTWRVVVSTDYTETTEINVAVDNIKVSGALEILVNDFKTYYTIKGKTLTIGAAGVPADHLFKYGKGKGLYEIEQNAEADQMIVTRLRAYGSNRNMPHRYYNSLSGADGKNLIPDNMAVQYLMLPAFPYETLDPYIDSKNIEALGIREHTIFFDGSSDDLPEIYPSIEGMTAEKLKAAGVPCNATGELDVLVSTEQISDNGVGEVEGNETKPANGKNTFTVTLKDLGFDINDYLTPETAAISFKSGKLGGREFEIVSCKKSGNNYVLELNRVYDDSIQLWFPYKGYNAEKGDKFVLLYIYMPEVYIKAASQLLKEKAEAYIAKNDYSRSIYAPKIDEIFMARQHDMAMLSNGKIKSLHDTLTAGMQLLFEDEDLNIDAAVFIDRLTIKEGDGAIPTYEVVLKEEKTVGTLQKMQNQIDSLAAGQGQGGGGYTAAQIRSLVNAYGGQLFLSKLKDDRSAGLIASDKGFEIGDFLAGVSGAMLGKETDSNLTFAELDKLYVRVKAYFETLTIINSEALAGEQRITPGGGVKITSVVDVGDYYECYYLSEQDGERTETKIVEGDLVICQIFNEAAGYSEKVSNRRYWRYVMNVNNDAYSDDLGNHYGCIDLAKDDCEPGSDEPMAGDTIVQFGNRYDSGRQAAIIFSTVDADAPSIKLLTGIEDYSIDDKDVISYGYDHVQGNAYFRCYGDTYIGAPNLSTYILFKRDDGLLEIKARIHAESTIGEGDDTVKDLLESFDATKYLREAFTQDTDIIGGVVMSSLVSLGYTDDNLVRHTLAGMNGIYNHAKSIASWWGGDMVDKFYDDGVTPRETPLTLGYAAALVRMDGSAYWANGNIGFNADGSGWLGNYENGIQFGSDGSLVLGHGLSIALNGSQEGLATTLESVLNQNIGIGMLFAPIDKNGKELAWKDAANAVAIKAKKNFVGVGEITAYGADSGSSGGNKNFGYLRELLDVNISTPSDGELLVYRNGRWVNESVAYGGGGLDETQLASYLSSHGYVNSGYIKCAWNPELKWAWGSNLTHVVGFGDGGSSAMRVFGGGDIRNFANAVNKSGDTMTGVLDVQTDVGGAINIRTLTTATNPFMRFWRAGSPMGNIGYDDANGFAIFNYTCSKHIGIKNDGTPHFEGNTIWYAGNDGTGSGLDADLLDGKYLSDILASNSARATKLQTARGIFGNSFDGSADVTGPRIMVNGVNTAGNYPNIMFHIPGVCYTQIQMDGNGALYIRDGGSQTGALKDLCLGSVYANNWFRSTGNTGWYNETYGGGIFMKDTTYVRTYGGKSFYCDQIIQSGSQMLVGTSLVILQTGGYGHGISLYANGDNVQSYGILFGKTANFGKHGAVQGDWATYFTMDGETNRGWCFRHKTGGVVASISAAGNFLANGEITAYSDIRLKSGINNIVSRGRLRPVSFTKDGSRHVGLIAQEVQLLCPESVFDGEYLSLNYSGALCYALAGVYSEIDVLKEENRKLKERVNELERRIA